MIQNHNKIEDPLTEAFSLGLKKASEIDVYLKSELDKCILEISSLDESKKKANLRADLIKKSLSDIQKGLQKESDLKLDPKVKFEELSPYLQKITKLILSEIEKKEDKTSRQIIESISVKEQHSILFIIKWLWDNRVIERNDLNLAFIPGPLWSSLSP